MTFQPSQAARSCASLWTLSLFCFVQIGCNEAEKNDAETGYAVEGIITGSAGKKIYLTNRAFYHQTHPIDSVVSDSNGHFLFKGKLKEPTNYELTVEEVNASVEFTLENAAISISGSVDSLWKALVRGSNETDISKEFAPFADFYANQEEFYAIEDAYDSALKAGDTAALTRLKQQKADLKQKFHLSVSRFINKYPTSLTSVNSISYFLTDGELEQADSILHHFEIGDIGSHGMVSFFRKLINAVNNSLPGKILPDFSQADTSGKTISLSSFRNNYVLVDFWASWCGPCRQENPTLIKIYERYKNKGFSILSVSLDDKKEEWLKAIEKDKLQDWTHVSDLKGFDNEAAKLYGISAIPASFLLDPSGKVIARGLRGEELEKAVAALFQ